MTLALLFTLLVLVADSASAGEGWHLLMPPSVLPDGIPVRWKPEALRQWGRAGTYDTATACEAAKKKRLDQVSTDFHTALLGEKWASLPDGARLTLPVLFDVHQAKCIASDDPRLK